MKIETTTPLFRIEKTEDGQFFAISLGKPMFCLSADTPAAAADLGMDALNSYVAMGSPNDDPVEDYAPPAAPTAEEVAAVLASHYELAGHLIEVISKGRDVLFQEMPDAWVHPPRNRSERDKVEDPDCIAYWGWRFHDYGDFFNLYPNLKKNCFELRSENSARPLDGNVIFSVHPPKEGNGHKEPFFLLRNLHKRARSEEMKRRQLDSLKLCKEAEQLRHSLSIRFKDKK